MDRKNNINWILLAKYLDQEMNEQEWKQMKKLIQSDEEYMKIISAVHKPWKTIKKQHNMIEVDTDSAWKTLKNKIEQTKAESTHQKNSSIFTLRKTVPSLLRIAAILVLATGLGYVLYRTVIQPDKDLQQLTVRSNSDQTVHSTLPDGSIVHLKGHSRINYKHRQPGTREVYLEGEAYFDVSYDPDEPFVVLTDRALVKVLGTSFSVRVEPNSSHVKVFVESGRVLLSDRSVDERSLVVEPGYIGTITEDGIRNEVNQNINWLAWKTGKLEFRETSLEDVINDLNHTFGTNIVYEDAKMTEPRFTGTFYNQPVDTLLQVLATAFNLDIEYSRSQITLVGESEK